MKRCTAFMLSALCLACAIATEAAAQTSPVPERDSAATSLFQYVTQIPKHNKAFNLDLEMHATFNTSTRNGRFDEAAFRFNQLKIEASGEVNDRLFYWYRQSLNQANGTMELENLPESIEYALIGFKLTEKLTVTAGKQPVDFGGFEYDLNPLEIYQYSDMNDYTACYFTGLSLSYQFTPSQELRLQVTDNRIGSMEETYGLLPLGIERAKAPLYYTTNWNSSYLNEQLSLRYSLTAGQQASRQWVFIGWAGQQLSVGPFVFYFDAMYTRGALDALGLISELAQTDDPTQALPCAQHADYLSLVAELNYRFHPKWNLFAKGMRETASIYKTNDSYAAGTYRTALSYQGGIAFYPMADDNLHLFVTGTARTYRLTEQALALGASIDNTARLSVGFIYKLPLF